jgi:hypothetical protein
MAKKEQRLKKSWRNRFRAFKRKRLYPIWKDIQWPLVGGIWILGIILGYIGFYRYSLTVGEESTRLDLFYRSIQLITLESGDIENTVPWQLEVARFLVPAVAAYAAIQALILLFHEQWQQLRVRFLKRHVVVCGLGDRGLQLVEDFLNHGFQVVTIEAEDENSALDQVRKQGALIMIGDATELDLLKRAGVHKANFLIAVCADDGTNAEIAFHARNLVRGRKQTVELNAYVHIVDLELCNLLSNLNLTTAGNKTFKLEFFNVLERGARLMLKEHPPFSEDALKRGKQPRMLIVGLGKMGRSLVVQAARLWSQVNSGKDRRLRITVVDKAVQKKIELLCIQHPEIENICEFESLQMEKNAPEFERGDFLFDADGRCDVDSIYICFDDDVHVLVNALTLHRKTKDFGVPIVVRMNRDAGMATLMREEHNDFDFGHIYAFGLLERTCNLEALFKGGINRDD